MKNQEKNLLDKGIKLVKEGRFIDAIEQYNEAQKINSNSFRFYIEKASLLIKMNREEEGIYLLNEAVKKFPKNPASYVFLGAALAKQGQTDLAKIQFESAISIDARQPLWVYYAASMQAFDIIDIDVEKNKIAYFPMPKCASSTIKSVFYKLQTGENTINAHPHYNNPFFKTQNQKIENYSDYFKFAVIRDPIKRFLSYFYKNIIGDRSLFGPYGGDRCVLGLDCLPNINYFIDRLDDYIYTFIDVRHHTLCQSAYLGESLECYDFICKLEDFGSLAQKIDELIGSSLEFPTLMKSKENIAKSFPSLSLNSLKKLINYYQKDYKLLEKYYSPDFIIQEYKEWLLHDELLR